MIKYSSRFKSKASFKDHYLERKLLIGRSIFAFIFVCAMLLVLVARAWYLQVVKFEDYQTRSNENRISVQPLPPKRGLIYDRNGVLLAENRSIYSLEIIPEQVKDLSDTLDRLIASGLIEDKHKEKFLQDLRGQRRFNSITVKSRLTEAEVAHFSVDRFKYPGVHVEARLVRYYPYADQLVHALGYVGRINDRELSQIDQANYKATRHIGKVGLEKYYEELLHGTIGFRQVETDVQGRVIGSPLFEKPPEPGENLRLSLDIRLQQVATKAMGNERGSVVAVDPRDGSILALVSNPGYDPNEFVTGISSADYSELMQSEDRPMFNRALRGLYSPGSTIKPILGWIGLETKTITTETAINDPGYWVIPNDEKRIYRDHYIYGHGSAVDLHRAIIKSCDPYFYQLAYRMGIDTLSSNMLNFGFGQFTGIDMGEEVPGIMPSRQWKMQRRKVPWFPGETVITGIGQGYWVVTPLQLANAVAQLSHGGPRYNLHLAAQVQDQQGWHQMAPTLAQRQANFSNRYHLDAVQKAMRDVNRPGGTGYHAFDGASYTSGGKTGTVQLTTQDDEDYDANKVKKSLRDNAVFVGYAPWDKPEIAIAVVVENAGHGGDHAAPVARKIFDEYFKNKQLEQKQASAGEAH